MNDDFDQSRHTMPGNTTIETQKKRKLQILQISRSPKKYHRASIHHRRDDSIWKQMFLTTLFQMNVLYVQDVGVFGERH